MKLPIDPNKFQNKYRIDTIRLPNHDYGKNGIYFVTICTKNSAHFFGKIENNKIKLSIIGQVANQCWLDIPKHFPFVLLDEFVIMPNHVHGIVVINKPIVDVVVPVVVPVEAQNLAPLQQREQHQPNKFGPQSQNLASIIRGFKTGVKKFATINKIHFVWQSRYYEHVVRDEKSFCKIKNYIKNNITNWNKDKNNSIFKIKKAST